MKTNEKNTLEDQLLTSRTIKFRSEHPETILLWERLLGTQEAGPDLHFCYHALSGHKNLLVRLDSMEYRIGFAINAHILHSDLQQRSIKGGLSGALALEHANADILAIYAALDQQEPSGRAAIFRSLQENH